MNQPFIGHVTELRRRLMWTVGMVLVVGCLAYTQRSPILAWLEAPLGQTLYYSRVTGAFEFIIKACLLVGVLAAAPLILYQIIAFVRPALPRPLRRRAMVGLIAVSCGLILGGVLFGYYVSLPAALAFLGSIDVAHLQPLLSADSYLSFVIAYLGLFGLIFLLPLVLLCIDSVHPLPPAKLRRARKWVILGAFAVPVIFPVVPDPASQLLLALPVIAMYEISIAAVWLRHRYLAKRAAKGSVSLVETPTPATPATPEQAAVPSSQVVLASSAPAMTLRIADGPRVISLRSPK